MAATSNDTASLCCRYGRVCGGGAYVLLENGVHPHFYVWVKQKFSALLASINEYAGVHGMVSVIVDMMRSRGAPAWMSIDKKKGLKTDGRSGV